MRLADTIEAKRSRERVSGNFEWFEVKGGRRQAKAKGREQKQGRQGEVSRVPHRVQVHLTVLCTRRPEAGGAARPRSCVIHVRLRAAASFPAVVVCVGSVVVLLGEPVSVVPQYVLQAGHALRVGHVRLLLAALVGLRLVLVLLLLLRLLVHPEVPVAPLLLLLLHRVLLLHPAAALLLVLLPLTVLGLRGERLMLLRRGWLVMRVMVMLLQPGFQAPFQAGPWIVPQIHNNKTTRFDSDTRMVSFEADAVLNTNLI